MRLNKIQEQNNAFLQEFKDKKLTTEEPKFELADVMGKMQWHTNKLFFAGKYNNWELADFYVEELEEALEELEESGLVENDISYGPLAKSITSDPINKLREAIESEQSDNFNDAYLGMVRACNNCHVASKHAFIRIVLPKQPVSDNQDFEPLTNPISD